MGKFKHGKHFGNGFGNGNIFNKQKHMYRNMNTNDGRKEWNQKPFHQIQKQQSQQSHQQNQSNWSRIGRHGDIRQLSKDEIQAQRSGLPITAIREQIIAHLKKEKTVIFIGETASGKTTQIPQYIHESGIDSDGIIAVTQPRRVAAISIASRVAAEMGCEVGKTVGYSVRFDEKLSNSTRIKFMTDGMLLREAISDPLLTKYTTIVLDEAHERSIQTDVLFGIVKRCQARRLASTSGHRPLRIVVMSATMDVDHFSAYFDDAPVFYLQGRQFPITTYYTTKSYSDYLEAALVTVLQIHREHSEGDILVFCTGQEEIMSLISMTIAACRSAPPGLSTSYSGPLPKLIPLPLHASLPPSEQIKVFNPTIKGSRKVIFATNVAETSLTIPGIKFVVDSCRMKARTFDAKTGIESLKVELISKAQAEQRAGRAGREGPGTAYRLVTEAEYETLKDFSVPEILRVSLANVMLNLVAIGINDIMDFKFMDPPKLSNFESAADELKSLGAIVATEKSKDSFRLTELGEQMVRFPLEPKYAKILMSSKQMGCTKEIITLISLMSVDNIFYIPPNRRESAADVLKKFTSSEGDHIMMLKAFRTCEASSFDFDCCRENYLSFQNMRVVRNVREQLIRLWHQSGFRDSSCDWDGQVIRRCLFTGLKSNVAILDRDGIHRTAVDRKEVFIHPSSCLFHTKPEAVMYTELVDTSKLYMRNVSLLSIDWLEAAKAATDITDS